jgi:pyruvyl transferase EpsI
MTMPMFLRARFMVSRWRNRSDIELPAAPRVFLFLAADYGNLGDVAITLAQRRFLERTLPSHQLVTVPISKTLAWLDSIRRQACPEDIITLIGGGNTGPIYRDIELLRRAVIEAFPNNPVIAFPQSVDFGSSEQSPRRIKRFLGPYWQHPHLFLCLREHRSLAMVAPIWPDPKRLLYVPDIVLSHPREDSPRQRRGVILSFREDVERARAAEVERAITEAVAARFDSIERRDTELGCRFADWLSAEAALEAHLDAYRGAELVVTDRLHGMILAERVGTPVLALDNSNKKISATHADWLADHPQVRLVRAGENLPEAIETLLRPLPPQQRLDANHPAYAPLIRVLQSIG